MAQTILASTRSASDNPKLAEKYPIHPEPYAAWMGLLSQSGTSAPTAVTKRNTLGGTPVFSRVAAGVYFMDLTNAFGGADQCCILVQSIDTSGPQRKIFTGLRISADRVALYTTDGAGNAADSILANNYVEIKVFPS